MITLHWFAEQLPPHIEVHAAATAPLTASRATAIIPFLMLNIMSNSLNSPFMGIWSVSERQRDGNVRKN